MGVKLSVSLPDSDVEILDRYAAARGFPSRSSAIQYAVRQLQHPDLERDYEEAWDEWSAGEEAAAWEGVVGDGIVDEAR